MHSPAGAFAKAAVRPSTTCSRCMRRLVIGVAEYAAAPTAGTQAVASGMASRCDACTAQSSAFENLCHSRALPENT